VASKINVCLQTRENSASNRSIDRALVSSPSSAQMMALVNGPPPTVLVQESAHSDTRLVLTTAVCLVLIRLPVAQSYQPVLFKEQRLPDVLME
jgi:hypothetical protein